MEVHSRRANHYLIELVRQCGAVCRRGPSISSVSLEAALTKKKGVLLEESRIVAIHRAFQTLLEHCWILMLLNVSTEM